MSTTATVSGFGAWTHIVPVGQTMLLFYNASTGGGALAELYGGTYASLTSWTGTWANGFPGSGGTAVAAGVNGLVLIYESSTGNAQAYGATRGAGVSGDLATLVQMTSDGANAIYSVGDFATGWSQIVGA